METKFFILKNKRKTIKKIIPNPDSSDEHTFVDVKNIFKFLNYYAFLHGVELPNDLNLVLRVNGSNMFILHPENV